MKWLLINHLEFIHEEFYDKCLLVDEVVVLVVVEVVPKTHIYNHIHGFEMELLVVVVDDVVVDVVAIKKG